MPQAPRQKVLLVGAHGETGRDILAGLVEDGGYVSGQMLSLFLEVFLPPSFIPNESSNHMRRPSTDTLFPMSRKYPVLCNHPLRRSQL